MELRFNMNTQPVTGSMNFSDDPYEIIKLRRDKIIERWHDEYTGEPQTSWVNIFDGLLAYFESYADDGASDDGSGDCLVERFDMGNIDEYDMYDEFLSFVEWQDIAEFDTYEDE